MSPRGRVVTLLGADGSGKSTVAGRLRADHGARYVYLGSNPASATHMLPTTRLWLALKSRLGRQLHHPGPPEPTQRARPTRLRRRAAQHAKSIAAMCYRVSEDAYRLLIVWMLTWRSDLVVLDRHPYPDYYMHRVEGSRGWRRIGDRIHGWLLEHLYPRPRSPVLLDAPAAVLFARKREGTIEALEARRTEYRRLVAVLDDVTVVDASLPEEEVVRAALRAAAESHSAVWTRTTDQRLA